MLRTLRKIFAVQPRHWRRRKVEPAQRVTIVYSDGRPDLRMTLSLDAWDMLSFAYAMDMDQAVIVDGATREPVVVDLRHLLALSHAPVEVLER